MSLIIVLIVAIIFSVILHFVGVYAEAKKTVWVTILLLWAAAINIAMSEVKPSAYDDIKNMKGKYADTDKIIEDSMPEVSIYEMLSIKKSFAGNEPKK